MILIHLMWFIQLFAKKKCKKAYLGETKRMLIFCLVDHFGYSRNQTLDKATGEHFSLRCHSWSDLLITVIEQSKRNNNLYTTYIVLTLSTRA